MPNPAPPAHPAARRRAAETFPRPGTRSAPRPGTGGGTSTSTSPVAGRQPSPALTGVPSSWTGLGPLLERVGERAPADALTLAAVTSGTGRADGRPQVDLSGIWAQAADMATARSTSVTRTLDVKGRLQLPVDADAPTRLPAGRDGALVTVYLPGSTEQPRPNYATNALPLDARGRLTVTAGERREAGIPDGADVLAVLDPDRRTVTLTAASRVDAGVTDLLDGLRRPAAAAFGDTARPEDEAVIPQASKADAGTGTGTGTGGRLRIVG
ncbi:hypothetical protein ACI8AG_01320 [Blastococcus sp. SYSU DS0552]